MRISTKIFGDIEVLEEQIVRFPGGIPGFEEREMFVFYEWEGGYPFTYLISLDEPLLSFLIVDPFYFYKDYEFDLPKSTQLDLEITAPEQISICTMVSVKDTLENATINLLAPLVINRDKRIGQQVVLHHSPYTTKHRLFMLTKADK